MDYTSINFLLLLSSIYTCYHVLVHEGRLERYFNSNHNFTSPPCSELHIFTYKNGTKLSCHDFWTREALEDYLFPYTCIYKNNMYSTLMLTILNILQLGTFPFLVKLLTVDISYITINSDDMIFRKQNME